MAEAPRGPGRQDRDEGTPAELPQVTPALPYYGRDSSFTLQAIMEMQKSIGELSAKVDRPGADAKGQGEKIEKLAEKVDKLRIWAASVIGGAAVVGFLIWLLSMWRGPITAWLARG